MFSFGIFLVVVLIFIIVTLAVSNADTKDFFDILKLRILWFSLLAGAIFILISQYPRLIIMLIAALGIVLVVASTFKPLGEHLKDAFDIELLAAGVTIMALSVALFTIWRARYLSIQSTNYTQLQNSVEDIYKDTDTELMKNSGNKLSKSRQLPINHIIKSSWFLFGWLLLISIGLITYGAINAGNINTGDWLQIILLLALVIVTGFYSWKTSDIAQSTKQQTALQSSIELFQEWRSHNFQQYRRTASEELVAVRAELLTDPKVRFNTLPSNLRDSVTMVSHFYDELGLLVRSGLLDKQLVLKWLAGSITYFWELFEPFIKRESEYRKSLGYSLERGSYSF